MAQEEAAAGTIPSVHAEDAATTIIIKKEKIDPEIEKKINDLSNNKDPVSNDHEQISNENGNGNEDCHQSSEDEDDDSEESSQSEPDEKKNIEPVKSSNEILAELFKVFNAALPEELQDDKNLIEKTKGKKEKKKKHKKDKSNDEHIDSDSDADAANEVAGGSSSKHKKKKKHKHKHKDGEKSKSKKKHKDSGKEKDKEKSREKKKSKEKDKDKSAEADRNKDKDQRGNTSKPTNHSNEEKLGIKTEPLESKKSSDHKRRRHDKDKDHVESSKRRKTDEKHNSFYSSLRDKDKHRDNEKTPTITIKKEVEERRSTRKVSEGDISEISLSDEDDYIERRDRETDFKKHKVHNSFYDGSNRSRSRENDRNYNKDRFRGHHYHEKDRERDRDRDDVYRHGHGNRAASSRGYSRRRSKSRSRSRDLGIDKKRLLEIARKNAISMFKRGNLPGCDNMTEDVKDKVLLKMRYGGRTVEDLTEFCKKISNGEHLSDLSSDEGSDVDKNGNAKAFHHPFQLKEREPIVMHIRNSKPILPVLPKTDEQTKTITMQFPVSSGQQHHMTEAWVPVEPKEKLPPLPTLPAAMQSTTIFKSTVPKNALGKPLPTESEQEPAFKPLNYEIPPSAVETTQPPANVAVPAPVAVPPSFLCTPPSQPATIPVSTPSMAVPPLMTIPPPCGVPPPTIVPYNFTPDVPVPSSHMSVFPKPPAHPMDVSSIISKRLNAMRRLQENPMDSEAIKMMYNSHKEMTTWAASKHLPGQFTGSTGVNVLKPNQLNSGPQIWAKRDQLTSSKPVTGGMGMHLLQKMGWKPGEGLGREKNGSLQPLLLDVKLDKRGLVAQEDLKPAKSKRGGGGGGGGSGGGAPQIPQNPQEKHPVCLLNEITTKYKWTPPMYNLVHENGPSHSRMFLFSVQVNNETYTPTKLCNTKKEAKFQAAKLCLQQMGILPPG